MTTTVLRPNAGTNFAWLADDSDATLINLEGTADGSPVTYGYTTKTLAAGEITKLVTTRIRTGTTAGNGYLIDTLIDGAKHGLTQPVSSTSSISTATLWAKPISISQSSLDSIESLLMSDDDDDTAVNVYELYIDLVTVALPVVAVDTVTPDPYTASTVVPISWVNTFDSDGGGQTHVRLKVFTSAQYGAGGFDPSSSTPFYDNGRTTTSATTENTGPLPSGDTYRAYVATAQTVNGSRHFSAYDFDEFTVTVPDSEVLSVAGVATDTSGLITVTVERDTGTEAWDFVEVERSIDSGTTWTDVRNATLVDATGDADTFVVADYEVANGQAVTYRARATRDSSTLPVTGPWVESSSTSWTATDDWIKAPLDPTLNMKLCPSGYGPSSRNTRSGTFDIIGSVNPVVVSDVLSAPANGTITYRTVGVAEARALDAILEGASGVLLLNLQPDSMIGPNRDGFTYVAILTVTEEWGHQYYRGSDTERRMVTISYTTVAAPADATAGEF